MLLMQNMFYSVIKHKEEMFIYNIKYDARK